MTEKAEAHQIHDSSHQSINVPALIGLIGDQFPTPQLNLFPTWCLASSDSHPEGTGEQMYDEGLTGQAKTYTHTHTKQNTPRLFVFGASFSVFGRTSNVLGCLPAFYY